MRLVLSVLCGSPKKSPLHFHLMLLLFQSLGLHVQSPSIITSFVDHLYYLCLVFFMLLCLFIAALWSPAGKGLTFWLLFVLFNCVFVTLPCGILGQVWNLIVLIPDLCCLSNFA